jgi:uncharacterized SAM-binding protein YcdF (DUF218 family)
MAVQDKEIRVVGIRKKRLRLLLTAGLLVGLVVFRSPILRSFGDYLIVNDNLSECEAMFVLSGNSFDRGNEAAKLFRAGWAPRIVCLGGEKNPALELYDIQDLSFEQTRRVLLAAGVPPSSIDSLPKGTSTFEEFEAIGQYCKERKLKKVMVVSSLFHTRRIHEFFRLRLHFQGVEMVLRGAPESSFDENYWWKREPGLLFVNSEYIKMGYYWTKY